MSLCLDLSNYDLATLDVPGFKAAGVDRVILGSWPRILMGEAATKLRAGGIEIIGFYGFIYFGDAFGETRDTDAAISLAKEFGVARVWLDCETDANQQGWHSAPTPTPSERVAAIARNAAAIRAAGLEPGIYTGGWWWPSGTDNSTAFADLPLWHSAYADNAGTYSEVRTVAYGGWTDVAIHQWTSTRFLCGKNRDCSTVFQEDDMPDPRVDDILRALTRRDGADATARLAAWNGPAGAQTGYSLLDGYEGYQQRVGTLEAAQVAVAPAALMDGDTVVIKRKALK